MEHQDTHPHTMAMQQCIQNCETCHRVCLETLNHCLHLGGHHAAADHIQLLNDCIQICQTSADFMLRGSSFHVYTCSACAAVCEACAESCLRLNLDNSDEQMQRCIDMCRRCAASCREMASETAA